MKGVVPAVATNAAAEVITGAGGLTRILTFFEVLVFELVAVIVTTTGVPLLEVGTPLILPVALSIFRPAGRFPEALKVAGADNGFSETGPKRKELPWIASAEVAGIEKSGANGSTTRVWETSVAAL